MNYVEGRDLIGSRDYASDLAAAYAARDLAHLEVPYLRLVGRSPELESLPTRSYFEFDEDQVDRQPDSITVAQTAPGVWRVESLHGCVPYPA